ncbi:MAG: NAD-dependent epimerase/dehydratase family protein [Opitutae bacterium]|nr:NAD-dependent epimerase/dehydratase family protein [Opitutae bacterium]
MHILVTGGAGFIGSQLVDRLLYEGNRVTIIDNLDPFYEPGMKHRNLADANHHAGFRWLERDICDADCVADVDGPVDIIVHIAAKAGVRPSIENPGGYYETNVKGTLHLLEFARKKGVEQFVFASSSSVYGVNTKVPWSETDEGLLPISPYASTKLAGEGLGHVYSKLYGIRFLALRFFTVYGPRQRPDLAIHKFALKILAGEPIPFFGDGSTRRDYTFVRDIVAGIRAAMDYRDTDFEVLNLGNNHTVSLIEMVQSLESALGAKAILNQQPNQPGDVPQTWADVSKAAKLLGYSPSTSFEEGIHEFTTWIKEKKSH